VLEAREYARGCKPLRFSAPQEGRRNHPPCALPHRSPYATTRRPCTARAAQAGKCEAAFAVLSIITAGPSLRIASSDASSAR